MKPKANADRSCDDDDDIGTNEEIKYMFEKQKQSDRERERDRQREEEERQRNVLARHRSPPLLFFKTFSRFSLRFFVQHVYLNVH
jgi:hypothetical protein